MADHDVYNKLLKSSKPEDEFLAMIAYSFYKGDKVKLTEEFTKKNDGVGPTPEEIEIFKEACCMDTTIAGYNARARELQAKFAANILDEKKKELRSGFMRGAYQSALGSFIFVICTGLLYFIVFALTVGPGDIMNLITGQSASEAKEPTEQVAPKIDTLDEATTIPLNNE